MEKKARRIIKKINAYFKNSGKKTAVIGISGGVDSALAAALCAKAIGARNVLGALLPSSFTPKKDMQDARSLCKLLRIKKLELNIEKTANQISKTIKTALKTGLKKETRGNSLARLRMLVLYALASEHGGLVIGTGDKSELSIGYFTKYGDGACDLLPIGNLYKTEARKMAKSLGIPKNICSKLSSPRLWKNHSAKNELGADYKEIDPILEEIEKGRRPKGRLAGKISGLAHSSFHKRRLPPIL